MEGKRHFDVEIGGIGEVGFDIGMEDYSRFAQEVQRNASSAAHNLLSRSVSKDRADALRTFLKENWGAAVQIVAPLIEELSPTIEVAVKKPRS